MTAYYNEFDPKAAAWLRELIRRGLIADGEVDERSILEVTADDLRGFTQCHFFAGIGGWSYALRLAEWPDDAPVWTGSPPCQPFSAAGQQKGKDDERHLAPHFAALVAAGRPPILFGEQVASAAVFGKAAKKAGGAGAGAPEWAWVDDLSGRLEAAHYAVGASDIPAASVGAPHIRQRTFFGAVRLAYTECGEWGKVSLCGLQQADGSERIWQAAEFTGGCDGHGLADAECAGSQGWGGPISRSLWEDGQIGARSAGLGLADADEGQRGWVANGEGRERDRTSGGWQQSDGEPERGDAGRRLADAEAVGRGEERQVGAGRGQGDRPQGGPAGHDAGGFAVGMGSGRPSPPHSFWADADWLFCRDGKWRPVEPGTFPLAHGVSARVGRLRGYGNAIVPQVAALFITAFLEAIE